MLVERFSSCSGCSEPFPPSWLRYGLFPCFGSVAVSWSVPLRQAGHVETCLDIMVFGDGGFVHG